MQWLIKEQTLIIDYYEGTKGYLLKIKLTSKKLEMECWTRIVNPKIIVKTKLWYSLGPKKKDPEGKVSWREIDGKF